MFGDHPLDRAREIAQQKTEETGRKHIVVPSEGSPGLYTIGVPIKAATVSDILGAIARKQEK